MLPRLRRRRVERSRAFVCPAGIVSALKAGGGEHARVEGCIWEVAELLADALTSCGDVVGYADGGVKLRVGGVSWFACDAPAFIAGSATSRTYGCGQTQLTAPMPCTPHISNERGRSADAKTATFAGAGKDAAAMI